MIARLRGTLIEICDGVAVVAPDGQTGLALEVLVPAYLARDLEIRAGESIELVTLQYLEGQNQGSSFIPRLIGFASTRDRQFFELLTSVKGLGNKRALRAMALEPGAIARAISERDTRVLQRLPEIGPKLAELIVHELKAKADRFALGAAETSLLNAAAGNAGSAATPSAGGTVEPKPRGAKKDGAGTAASAGTIVSTAARQPPVRQTVDALIALGESPMEAERLVAKAIDAARAAGSPMPSRTDELLSAAYASR